jgi:UDP-N-acetylglucosamine transferase subunit ALG13
VSAPDVFVSVGTDHHPFERLVRWADAWAAAHPERRVLVQRGTAPPATVADAPAYLPFEELRAGMAGATVVVSHGGPATIMDARASGHLPIVVPRQPGQGEHVDDHQVRFARWMQLRGQVVVAETEDDLHALLDEALAAPDRFRVDTDDPDVRAAVARLGQLIDGLLVR